MRAVRGSLAKATGDEHGASSSVRQGHSDPLPTRQPFPSTGARSWPRVISPWDREQKKKQSAEEIRRKLFVVRPHDGNSCFQEKDQRPTDGGQDSKGDSAQPKKEDGSEAHDVELPPRTHHAIHAHSTQELPAPWIWVLRGSSLLQLGFAARPEEIRRFGNRARKAFRHPLPVISRPFAEVVRGMARRPEEGGRPWGKRRADDEDWMDQDDLLDEGRHQERDLRQRLQRGMSWSVWRNRNIMAMEKAFPRHPIDLIFAGISFMQKWAVLLSRSEKPDAEVVMKKLASWTQAFVPQANLKSNVVEWI